MGTKRNPGQFDCHAKAADDEPIFTLRAKDPVAPHLIELWRQLRAGVQPAMVYSTVLAAGLALAKSKRTPLPLDSEKSIEASKCAAAMVDWHNANVRDADASDQP